MSNVISLNNFKTLEEWKEFAEKQLITIQFLQEANKHLQEELKKSLPIKTQGVVSTIIVSPEQALLDDQILMIQTRAYMKELNLEDVKKLDILLKNQRLIKEDSKTIDVKSKPVHTTSELLQIAQGSNEPT